MEKRVSMDMKVIYAVVAFVAMLISSNVSYWLVNSILEKLPANVFLTVIGLLVMTALHLIISLGITTVFLFIKYLPTQNFPTILELIAHTQGKLGALRIYLHYVLTLQAAALKNLSKDVMLILSLFKDGITIICCGQ